MLTRAMRAVDALEERPLFGNWFVFAFIVWPVVCLVLVPLVLVEWLIECFDGLRGAVRRAASG